MYNIVSLVFKYLFIVIIYAFMLSIIRLIYLDIRGIDKSEAQTYLKLINMKEDLPFKVSEHYSISGDVTIGRGSDNKIVIRDPFISKEHMKIFEESGEYYIEDLKSANGTYLNDGKVDDVEVLSNGDIIQLGQIGFIFVDKE